MLIIIRKQSIVWKTLSNLPFLPFTMGFLVTYFFPHKRNGNQNNGKSEKNTIFIAPHAVTAHSRPRKTGQMPTPQSLSSALPKDERGNFLFCDVFQRDRSTAIRPLSYAFFVIRFGFLPSAPIRLPPYDIARTYDLLIFSRKVKKITELSSFILGAVRQAPKCIDNTRNQQYNVLRVGLPFCTFSSETVSAARHITLFQGIQKNGG